MSAFWDISDFMALVHLKQYLLHAMYLMLFQMVENGTVEVKMELTKRIR